ncbi:MAG: response regulator [Bacterioplanes sp.]|nr:response regulator [Bacterioplanes sp.]
MTLNRIMHVEDDESIRLVVEMSLVDVAGFELLSCDGGESALQQVVSFAPQLILLDVMMPKMDGLQTLAALREIPHVADIPVVMMTAKIQDAEKQHYLQCGAVAVLNKPFDPMTLGKQLLAIYQQHTSR